MELAGHRIKNDNALGTGILIGEKLLHEIGFGIGTLTLFKAIEKNKFKEVIS
jgi:hypothetical protein